MAAPAALQRLSRRQLLSLLKSAEEVTDLVPVANIAPPTAPAWPFIMIESPRTNRLRSACVRGAVARFDVHAFAGPREDAGAVVETGYDHVSRIAAAVEGALADNRVTLEGGATCKIELSDAQFLRDGEPDAWHWVCQVNCRVLAEAV